MAPKLLANVDKLLLNQYIWLTNCFSLKLRMPEISGFYGIIIKMFFNDHNPPHFHIEYQDYTSVPKNPAIANLPPQSRLPKAPCYRLAHLYSTTLLRSSSTPPIVSSILRTSPWKAC